MEAYSLEIVTFLYCTSLSMSAFFQNNLLLRKACNPTVPFGECTAGEASAQHVVSIIHSWKSPIQYTVPVVLVILAGAWSDNHGAQRKPLIFIPLIGQILTDILCILNVYFWNWPPQVAALFEAITPSLFGGRTLYWVGVISLISDGSLNEKRTLKYGIMNATYSISSLVGTGLAGLINVKLGFYGAFLVPILLNVTAAVLCMFLIKNNSKPYDKNVEWLKPTYFWKSYLSVFKRRTKVYTVTLIGLLLCQAVLVARIGGEFSVMYLFMRYKFQWYEMKYSYYAAYKMVSVFLGTLFAVIVLSHRLKINDAIIGFIACFFDILAALCYVFVNEPWQLFTIPLIDFFHGTALTISTSITSKIVDADELGRVNSVQGITNAIASFIIISLYSATYHFTFEYLAGAVFILNIILTFPVLLTFTILYSKYRNLWIKEPTP